jgi:hypothetical protein
MDTLLFYTIKSPKLTTGIPNLTSVGSLERLDLLESRSEEIFTISCILISPKIAKLAISSTTEAHYFKTALQKCGGLNGK